jgi:hypothetical protein
MCELHEITKHTSKPLKAIRVMAWTSFVISMILTVLFVSTDPFGEHVFFGEVMNALWITLGLFIIYGISLISKEHYENHLNKVTDQ